MPRIKTGIPRLDEMLGGGFLEGDTVMIAGSPGTGKSSMALQYLVEGIKAGQPGLYVTFEQLPEQIHRDAQNFGWNLSRFEEDGNLRIVLTSPNILLEPTGYNVLEEPIKQIRPRRIVIDSMSHLAIYTDDKELRKEAYRIMMYLKTKKLSSILIWETPQMMGPSVALTEVGLSFLVDCVILLRLVEIESSIHKALAILKMRGSDHDKSLVEYTISSQGILMADKFSGYEGVITGSPRHAASETFLEMFQKAARRNK
jgi:circadian clock protein KaiC